MLRYLVCLPLVIGVSGVAHAQTVSAAGTSGVSEGAGDEAESTGGFFLRTTLVGGYAHFLYLTSERDGGGPVLGAAISIGHVSRDGLVLAGTATWEPILLAEGETGEISGRAPWGPLFTPRGSFGFTIGYVSGILELDLTLGLGGGGNRHMGGFGVSLVPSVGLVFFESESIHLGASARPNFSVLYDFNSDRPLVDLGMTLGVFFSYR